MLKTPSSGLSMDGYGVRLPVGMSWFHATTGARSESCVEVLGPERTSKGFLNTFFQSNNCAAGNEGEVWSHR